MTKPTFLFSLLVSMVRWVKTIMFFLFCIELVRIDGIVEFDCNQLGVTRISLHVERTELIVFH